MVKKGLGRGFDSLIPDTLFDESFDPTSKDDQSVSQLRVLRIADISVDPEQPRKHFDDSALEELAASIKRHGVLQPIVVTPTKKGFEIVAGERRYRASKRAGHETIPALVRSVEGQHRLELALIENLQRRDLNALETAVAYAKLRDQFNLSLEAIGQSVGGKSVSAISNTLRLLKLPHEVQVALADGLLKEGQARPLIDVEANVVHALLPRIIKEQWSARAIEQAIRAHKESTSRSAPRTVYVEQTKSLVEKLHAPVAISANAKGKGKITISFKNDAELMRLLEQLS